ncbi:MAG: DNA topoisomerase 1 [marine bacterium B5-7]|nr:MAG: DNA topoisomerase 1 [marine bacterium B5-7]
MSKYVVVVESPAKSKTIKKYLGKDFVVFASYGHVRDLVAKEGAVETDNDFAMRYEPIDRNAKHVDVIVKALRNAEALYLATDPDREGEAISWHLCELLRKKRGLKDKPVYRVVFHEITKTAVKEAVANPRELAMPLVDAQQARRALDFLVGFNLSPLLWKKVRRGLSAGRVQSPALRLIVEREDEIEAFNSQEYWTIGAEAAAEKQSFQAKLVEYQGKKVEQFTVTDEKTATEYKQHLLDIAEGKLLVSKIEKKQRKRNPAAPFITSTLQQEAVRKLGFTAKRTMRTAQQLYEGIDIGEGTTGLITYMRTDSVTLAKEAIFEIRDFIQATYGEENLPNSPRMYKTKSKNAQEAHEAIRPTLARHTPESIRRYLSDDQFKLYNLIWKRTVACQMQHATINTVAVDLFAGDDNRFRANGSQVAKPGFLQLYIEGTDDNKGLDDSTDKLLPALTEGEEIDLLGIMADQHFTEPPPRYSEASLVKTLEEYGIGRPSTYASITSTIQDRGYVVLEKKRFHPTDVGRVVTKFLTKYFTHYVDFGFTAQLEDQLDSVSRGEKNWIDLLREFWQPFKDKTVEIDKNVERKDVTQEKMDEDCPECKSPLSIRLGRRGRFVGCTNYPDCSYTRNLKEDPEDNATDEALEGRTCPKCEKPLVYKHGPYGKFIGCSGYPDCKFIESLNKPEDTGQTCPDCNKGNILKRKSRRGKIFYSCEHYPKCKYALWDEPIDGPCPKCGWPILTVKTTKKRGTERRCPQDSCKFSEPYENPEKPAE